MYRSFTAFLQALSHGAAESRLLELDGVVASIAPGVPERSFFNSVIYERPEAIAASLGELERAYEAAGVDAWTVWVPQVDLETAALLKSAGHVLDAAPEAMVLQLSDLEGVDPGDLDWSREPSLSFVARANDAAYGYEVDTFGRAIGATPAGTYRMYVARDEGVDAAVLGTLDCSQDCAVLWVATLPAAQGRGLAKRLLSIALTEARDRGCSTATLQATRAGAPVYRRLGFREVGALQMWERRSAASA